MCDAFHVPQPVGRPDALPSQTSSVVEVRLSCCLPPTHSPNPRLPPPSITGAGNVKKGDTDRMNKKSCLMYARHREAVLLQKPSVSPLQLNPFHHSHHRTQSAALLAEPQRRFLPLLTKFSYSPFHLFYASSIVVSCHY